MDSEAPYTRRRTPPPQPTLQVDTTRPILPRKGTASDKMLEDLRKHSGLGNRNEWIRAVALGALQTAAAGLELLQARMPVFTNPFNDVKNLTNSAGAIFAGYDLTNLAYGVTSISDWETLLFDHLPSVLLALSSIRTITCETHLPTIIPQFVSKHVSQELGLFVAGLIVSCFHIKGSISQINLPIERKNPNQDYPHVLRIIGIATLTAYHALGLRSNGSTPVKFGLLAVSTACTFFAGPVKSSTQATYTEVPYEYNQVSYDGLAAPDDDLADDDSNDGSAEKT